MPSIRVASATTTDALASRKFNVIPPGGAIMNVWGSSANNGDTFGISVGDREIVTQGTELNVEVAADVIDTDRDQLVFNEVCPPGQIFLPLTVTAEGQFLIHLRYL